MQGGFGDSAMKGRIAKFVVSVVCVAAGVALLADRPAAFDGYGPPVRKTYKVPEGKDGACRLCHQCDEAKGRKASGKNVNGFSRAVKKTPEFRLLKGKGKKRELNDQETDALDAAIKAVADQDSDGDGTTNGEELACGTLPGDPASVPAKEVLEKYRQEHSKK
jgi:hypothetical protein